MPPRSPRSFRSVCACLTAAALLLPLGACSGVRSGSAINDPEAREWIDLFNGRDLTGWTVKVHRHDVGVNFGETFRVADGLKPQIGGGGVGRYDRAIKQDGKLLSQGFIALQSEGQPIDFRNVRLLDLRGCIDPRSANHKAYFVEADDYRCRY
jgi:hypothetical protein